MSISYPVYRAGGHLAVVVALVAFAATTAGAQTVTLKKNSSGAALQKWAAQIDAHVPGDLDAPAIAHAGLRPQERALLVSIAGPFTHYLRHLKEAKELPGSLSPQERTLVTALAKKITGSETFSAWMQRAVMFETDVAVLAPELTAEAMESARNTGIPQAIQAEDGELGARALLNWHWKLARDLVDQRESASDAFAASWYHAVALHQLDMVLLGELAPHTLRGFQQFPTDARIQFDDACFNDAMGSARVQALMIGRAPQTFRPSIPAESSASRQASTQFARALELDPNFAEPQVRLARLMEKSGKASDALLLLLQASRLRMSPELEYMSHLIAARASGALGRFDDGREHVKAALKLFPTAQAPLVTLSQLALESGDIDGAVAAASQLRMHADRGDRIDPWWSYFQASWLDWKKLLDQLRDQVKR